MSKYKNSFDYTLAKNISIWKYKLFQKRKEEIFQLDAENFT